ncbi:hypothetical protein GCM10027570_45490 [Streptomonospora sediminis]
MYDQVRAVQDALAPLKSADAHAFGRAVGYVAEGADPDVLELLPSLQSEQRAMIARPEDRVPADRIDAVRALCPGWTREAAEAGRRAIYRDASADVLARFGRVLDAANGGAAPNPGPSWLRLLADDVVRLFCTSNRKGGEPPAERWTPDFAADIARCGGVPHAEAPRVVLTVLVSMEVPSPNRHRRLIETAAGDDFLERHRGELAQVARGLDSYSRRHLPARCIPRREAHATLLAGLAADTDPGVRAEALAVSAWLDARVQVALLAPHLRTAEPEHLQEILKRLTDLDGGLAVMEEALEAVASGPPDTVRKQVLQRTADRARVLRAPAPELAVPPCEQPADGGLRDELRTRPLECRYEDDFWPGVQRLLPRLPDVRALRDALAAAGMADADRRTVALLVTRIPDDSHALIGAELTPQDADRWWPLFAERLDLVDEYLDLADEDLAPGVEPIDTTAMMLRILERFPAAPEVLVPRLADLALGHTRHRRAARRVLAGHPRVRAIAEGALSAPSGGAEVRASAAEWLAELGDTSAVPPERGWEFGPGVLPEAVRALPADVLDRLERFREKALAQGIPPADADRWLGLARPCAALASGGDGPVAARLGGPLMLPPDVPTPANDFVSSGREYHVEHQLIATLDLSAIPPEASGLPSPPDGCVLLFANPELEPLPFGGAVYVPAGTPVEERDTNLDYEPYAYDTAADLDAELRSKGGLRMRRDVTLPFTNVDDLLAVHPHANSLRDVWAEVVGEYEFGEWQVGGHAWDHDHLGDPVSESGPHDAGNWTRDRPQDPVLLAQWNGLPMASLYWTITRQDLAARRFDRVNVIMYANP